MVATTSSPSFVRAEDGSYDDEVDEHAETAIAAMGVVWARAIVRSARPVPRSRNTRRLRAGGRSVSSAHAGYLPSLEPW